MEQPKTTSTSSAAPSPGRVATVGKARDGAEILLRRSDSNSGKQALKEKFVAIYESIFTGNDPSQNSPLFWEELFLLKVNVPYLERCIVLTIESDLIKLKPVLNEVFKHAVANLVDRNPIRVAHALETIAVLLKNIFRKKLNSFAFEVSEIVCGFPNCDSFFKTLIHNLNSVIMESKEVSFRHASLQVYTIFVTATDNINQNTLLEYFMQNDVFIPILRGIILPTDFVPHHAAMEGLFVLTALMNYNKYESLNPYCKMLRELDDSPSIGAIQHHLSRALRAITHIQGELDTPNTGVMDVLTSFFTSWIPVPKTAAPVNSTNLPLGSTLTAVSRTNPSILLPLYESVNLNPFFREAATQEFPSSSPDLDDGGLVLMSSFIGYGFYIFDTCKDARQAFYTKLSVLIFLKLTEDDKVSKALHEKLVSVPFLIGTKLHWNSTKKKPVISVILDLMVLYIKKNFREKLQFGLYHKALNVIHRIICYEKRERIQLHYNWSQLWEALISILKFLASPKKFENKDAIQLCIDVTTIFNLFITYGDTFLSQNTDYDNLYYTLIHQSKLLDQLYRTAEATLSAGLLVQQLENIRTITRHFSAKLDQWQNSNPHATLSETQVLNIIRNNYVTLKLNLIDGLDHYERYAENPQEIQFFRKYMRMSIYDYKTTLEVKNIPINIH